jgi:hypothetical protein
MQLRNAACRWLGGANLTAQPHVALFLLRFIEDDETSVKGKARSITPVAELKPSSAKETQLKQFDRPIMEHARAIRI